MEVDPLFVFQLLLMVASLIDSATALLLVPSLHLALEHALQTHALTFQALFVPITGAFALLD